MTRGGERLSVAAPGPACGDGVAFLPEMVKYFSEPFGKSGGM
jgi:hypothetical protein